MLLDETDTLADVVERAVKSALDSRPLLPNSIAFTAEQAAVACGLSYRSIRNAIACCELRAVKRRGKHLIKREDLVRWLEDE